MVGSLPRIVDPAKTRFFVHYRGDRIARITDGGKAAYLNGEGWVELRFRSKLKSTLLDPEGKDIEARGWKACDPAEARERQTGFFNETCLYDDPSGLGRRIQNFLDARGLWSDRRRAPHGPAPRHVDRGLQRETQKAWRSKFPVHLRGDDLTERIEEARQGYEREESRIDDFQQRATYFLGAAGLTTSLVLVNGGLLYGGNALSPGWLRSAVGVLLLVAAVMLFLAGMAALDATTITFDRVLPNSVRQIPRRAELAGEEARRDLLAALLLAAQRAEAIGDWKLSKLKRARMSFGFAVMFVLLGGFVVLAAALVEGGSPASHGISFSFNW